MTLSEAKSDLATWKTWPVWRKFLFAAGLTFLAAVFLFVGYCSVIEPLKFSYLIHRVTSARTADEERSAFLLAHRFGTVWELHVSEGTTDWFDFKQLDAAIRDSNRVLRVEIEWLEWPLWGSAYRAARNLTEKTNLHVLLDGFPKR